MPLLFKETGHCNQVCFHSVVWHPLQQRISNIGSDCVYKCYVVLMGLVGGPSNGCDRGISSFQW